MTIFLLLKKEEPKRSFLPALEISMGRSNAGGTSSVQTTKETYSRKGMDYDEVLHLWSRIEGHKCERDDIIFGSRKKELCDEFEKLMKDKFQMSYMGELTFFLGLQVQQSKKGIFINLEKPLVKDGDAADVDEHLYRSIIGSLMYLTTSRPDIMFVVCACARFQVSPKSSHLLSS
ncbi:uncharacterized mitochondrial protein-like protein [Tanacetum coccineum]